jgi:hypothetical protein
VKFMSFLSVKFITFHLPDDYWDNFYRWEQQIRSVFEFDSGAYWGGTQMFRVWELDFMESTKRKALLRILRDEIKRRGWFTIVLGNGADVYVGRNV